MQVPLENLSHKLIGKLVWYFPRSEKGVSLEHAKSGILMDVLGESCHILDGTETTIVWSGDIMEMEDWDENLERENSQMERPWERTRKLSRDSSK